MKRITKIRKLQLLVVLGMSLVIVLTILGQETEQNDRQMPLIIKSPQKEEKAIIIAIRRAILIVEDLGPDGLSYEKRVPHVEIELFVGDVNFNTNLAHLVQIGDREFGVYSWNPSGERYNAVLLIPAQEFEELVDGAEVFFRICEPISREVFKKMHDEGKLPKNSGIKVGRLDKKMIDLEPTVERSAGWKRPL